MDLLFINVYAVTRHYGGPEEGSWYYDCGEPLASVPIKARRERGHPDYCTECNGARSGRSKEDGIPYSFCKDLPSEEEYESAIADLIWSWTGGSVWSGTEEYRLEREKAIATIESNAPEAHHLLPVCSQELESRQKELQEMFAGEAHGNIGHSTGGVEIRVMVQEHMAAVWPAERPRYE